MRGAGTGLQPYLRIWEGFLEEVTSRDLKDEYELVMQRERKQRGEDCREQPCQGLPKKLLPGRARQALGAQAL